MNASAAAPSAQATTAPAEVATTDLTPGKIKSNVTALFGKTVRGEAVFYAFESGKVGTEMAYSAYIADDEKQTNSIRCMTRGDPKLAKNTKVTFEGVVKGGQWIDSCKLTAKK